jgi:hypothetical protein
MAEPNLAELQQQLAAIQAEINAAETSQKADLSSVGVDFFNHVISTNEFVTTESTGRHGLDVSTLPFMGEDDRAYTVTLHFTDVERTAKQKARLKVQTAAATAAQKAVERVLAAQKKQGDILAHARQENPVLDGLLNRLDADEAVEAAE